MDDKILLLILFNKGVVEYDPVAEMFFNCQYTPDTSLYYFLDIEPGGINNSITFLEDEKLIKIEKIRLVNTWTIRVRDKFNALWRLWVNERYHG